MDGSNIFIEFILVVEIGVSCLKYFCMSGVLSNVIIFWKILVSNVMVFNLVVSCNLIDGFLNCVIRMEDSE